VSTPISAYGSNHLNPHVISGQHKLYARSHDGLKWIMEPGAQDGFGPHHSEQEPAGNSVHDYIMGSIPAGGTFLDIGAHVGHYTLRAALKCGWVWAVEANPETSARLKENLRLNGIKNVTILAMAASDHRDIVHLASGINEEEDCVRSGGKRTLTGLGTVMVPALPLDSLPFLPRIDTVKIDTEGSDIAILRGMHETLARHRPKLIVEDHSYLGYYDQAELRREEEVLTDLAGYAWHDIAEFGVRAIKDHGTGLNYRIGIRD
jgi:FkbM family methyltransferase